MKSHGNSGFLVNIRINAKEIITLHELCTSDTKIFDLKEILLKERNLNDLNKMILKYNDIIMENDKTLSDYNIIDSRHIITLSFSVVESTHTGPVKKYSFVKDDPTLGVNNNNNNYSDLPAYLRPLPPTRCQRFCRCFRECCTCERTIIIIFILYWLSYVAINIGNSVALGNQYQIYREYIHTSTNTTTEMLDYYCNNKGSDLKANMDDELFNGFIINIASVSSPFVAIISLCVLFGLIECMDKCDIYLDYDTEDNLGVGCTGFFIISMFGLHVTMIVYNSIILWGDIMNIQKYCDPNTQFYHEMIIKWSIWNYMNTFVTYMGIPCMLCLFIAVQAFAW